jgi:hypothetical protein
MNFTVDKARTPASNIIPAELRGDIKGTVKNTCKKDREGMQTNAAYASEKGITKRAASKQRRGY